MLPLFESSQIAHAHVCIRATVSLIRSAGFTGRTAFALDMLANEGVVESMQPIDQPQVMFNLTVGEAHTFFVGDGQWLVHNQLCVRNGVVEPLNPDDLIVYRFGDQNTTRFWESGFVATGGDPNVYNTLSPQQFAEQFGGGRTLDGLITRHITVHAVDSPFISMTTSPTGVLYSPDNNLRKWLYSNDPRSPRKHFGIFALPESRLLAANRDFAIGEGEMLFYGSSLRPYLVSIGSNPWINSRDPGFFEASLINQEIVRQLGR